jgi:hypothetical protein
MTEHSDTGFEICTYRTQRRLQPKSHLARLGRAKPKWAHAVHNFLLVLQHWLWLWVSYNWWPLLFEKEGLLWNFELAPVPSLCQEGVKADPMLSPRSVPTVPQPEGFGYISPFPKGALATWMCRVDVCGAPTRIQS